MDPVATLERTEETWLLDPRLHGVGPVRRRFNVAEYYRMAEVGILAPDAHVELLDGQLVEMHPAGPSDEPPRWRFSVADYYKMAEAGILAPDERVELIEGQIVAMSPLGNRHVSCVARLSQTLTLKLHDRAIVMVQSPIRFEDHSEPEPDLAVVKYQADFYEEALPTPGDVLLLIEVADSTVRSDRLVKMPMYAKAGIPETWLCVLPNNAIEVYRDPSPAGYGSVQTFKRGQTLTPVLLPDLTLAVDELFG